MFKTAGAAVLLALSAPASDNAYFCLPQGDATMAAAGLELVVSYLIAGLTVSSMVLLRRSDVLPVILAELVIVSVVGAGLSIWLAVQLRDARCF